MLKDDSTQQLELFRSGDSDVLENIRAPLKEDSALLEKMHRYKKNILFFIIFLFVSLISFSLGIEKGKKIVRPDVIKNLAEENMHSLSLKEAIVVPAGQPSKQQTVINKERVIPSVVKKKQEKIKKKEELKKANYTIQVASVLQKKNVNAELSKLKSKGYSAFSLSKGKYTVICIGKFNLKEDAQQLLQKIKSNYPDSQIRRL